MDLETQPLQNINSVSQMKLVSCHEIKLHNDFADSLVTRGLSPLPLYVLELDLETKPLQNINGVSQIMLVSIINYQLSTINY